ncbi:ABC transporter permease [Streptomyces sp. NBC_01142]|uniref:ABC transporter permease n=1 Tax=Streptomyces sp. NBC_01142 TaxID=2975865 RepID=UPI0022512FDA|nr:ABC transporter permease [Streptomyces sp. NBC_01142]MCX4824156.1 ABC transporter permease [Streptomyces sp. NBC_01142]
MSTTDTAPATLGTEGAGAAASARPVKSAGTRMAALARAELTLLGRNKATLLTALVLPAMLTLSMSSAVDGMELEDTGLTMGTVLLPGALGFSLLFTVYSTLVGVFVVRREELVLKRLRTGELRDREILAGASIPSVVLGLVQCVALAVGCTVVMDVPAPQAVWLALAGLVLGLAMICALAAATAATTKSAEGAQIAVLPMLLLSMAGSGMVVPLDVMPDKLASACELLPLTPVIGLIRSGWTGGASGAETLGQAAVVVAWTIVAVFAVRKWFRWEPRR